MLNNQARAARHGHLQRTPLLPFPRIYSYHRMKERLMETRIEVLREILEEDLFTVQAGSPARPRPRSSANTPSISGGQVRERYCNELGTHPFKKTPCECSKLGDF